MGGSVKRMLASSSTKRTRLGGCDEDAILSVSLRAHWKLRNLLRTSLYHTFLTFKHKAHRTLWPGDREFGAGQSCRRRLSLAPGARCGIIGAGESPREGAEAGARAKIVAKFEGHSIVEGSRSGSVATRAPSHGAQVAVLAREAVIITDVSGGIVFWNESAAQLYGWREEEVLGVSPVELLKTELPRPLAQIENILRGEEYWDYELSQTTRDGKQVI